MKDRRDSRQAKMRTQEYGYLKRPNSPYVISPVIDPTMRPFQIPEPLIPRPNRGYFTNNN